MINTPIPTGSERRREDYPLITGHAHYVDDLRAEPGRPAALHMVVVRSPYAHAKLQALHLEAAQALPGVVAALSASDLVETMPAIESIPIPRKRQRPPRKPLATQRVRYVGDPVAVIVAETLAVILDARDLVEIDYEPLPAVVEPEEALAPDAPVLYEDFGSNLAFSTQVSSILVQSGVATNGQGHFTTIAQIAAAVFAVPDSQVEVQMNDSALPAFGIGTFGSRTAQIAGTAVYLAAEAAREKVLSLAALQLEAAPPDLDVANGQVSVRGVPTHAISLGQLATIAEEQPELIEQEGGTSTFA